MTNEWLTNHQQVEARSGVGRGDKVIFEEKKCTGESGDVDDIVKNVNIAMQKKCMRKVRQLRQLSAKCLKNLKNLSVNF